LTNPSKSKGTAFETATCRYLAERLGQEPYRAALHGNRDVGDLHGVTVAGMPVLIECKAHKSYGPADVAEWHNQTLVEVANARAAVGLLVIKQPGTGAKTFGRNRCDLTVADLLRMLDAYPIAEGLGAFWATLDLSTVCDVIRYINDNKEDKR
jgi:hypothetical protein